MASKQLEGKVAIITGATDKVASYMATTLPLNRTARPRDIAKAALFLCSDDASYITAQNLIVDGAEARGKKYSEQGLH